MIPKNISSIHPESIQKDSEDINKIVDWETFEDKDKRKPMGVEDYINFKSK